MVPALALGWLANVGPTSSQPALDCRQLSESRTMLGRMRLAEIEGAEDIHRAAMWDAFGHCPAGTAGEPCREAERRRFVARWEEQKRRIEDRYRTLLDDLEQRCRTVISLG